MPLSDQSASPAALRRQAAIPLLMAALVFLAALIVTFMVADTVEDNARERVGEHLQLPRPRPLRLAGAPHGHLRTGAAGRARLPARLGRRQPARLRRLLQRAAPERTLPGIEALGIAAIIPPARLPAHVAAMRAAGFPDYEVKPPGPRELYTAVTHIQPFEGRNLRAFGYDMFSEPVRRAAMEAARDSGAAAATGRVTLVQEGTQNVQSGFLMYVPVYRPGLPRARRWKRRAAIAGWVYAPFRMNDLMRGLGGEHASDLEVRSTTAGRRSTPPCCTARPAPVRGERGPCSPTPTC
jgi:CHASE1-domain containing sensor protein